MLSTDTSKSNSTFGTFSDMCPEGPELAIKLSQSMVRKLKSLSS